MNRRSIGFIVFILLAVAAGIAFGTPNLPYYWYDGEIVRGTKINLSLGNKFDNARPVLATYTTVAAGATIAVPSTYGYVRITDDGTAAANEVTVAAGTDGQMLFVFNGDAQATVGAVTIPTLTGKWGIYASGIWTFSEQSGLSESVAAHIASTGVDVHGLGTISTVNSPVPIANGGTGQTASSAALAALGGANLTYVSPAVISDAYAGKYWAATASPAAFTGRSAHSSVVYGGKMWVIGGNDGEYKRDVWNSVDGITWFIATTTAAFTGRCVHSSVVYGGKMWVIGGNDGGYKRDVWNSTDGVTWSIATTTAAFSVRGYHTSVVYNDKMWVIGGYDGAYKQDVWNSTDGITWSIATTTAAFTARRGHTSVVYGGKMWIIGGNDGGKKRDVWNSVDGITWSIATTTAAFTAREGHTSMVYGSKMWIIGGNDGVIKQDVWQSGDSD